MFNLKYLIAVFSIALMAVSVAPVLAQTTQPVHGVVKVHKKDGTESPVSGALVESYRTDLGKGAGPTATTNKKGEFSFVGFQLGFTYALAISGTGINPVVEPNIKAGNDNITVIASEGDGRKATEDEVRQFVASGAANNKAADPKAQTKEDEEYKKKVAAYEVEKKKAEDTNKIVNAAFTEGDKLYKAKDYDAAISKFDEGINADPEFEGSAPILLNYKAVALKDRGVASYNKSVTADADAKAAALEKAKTDLLAAAAALDKALAILKKAPASADAAAQKGFETTRKNILSNYVDVFRLIGKTRADATKAKEAPPIFTEYLATETDPTAKLNAQVTLGDLMLDAGDSQGAIDAYTAVLQTAPDNVDALAGIGFSLVNLGYLNNDKTKFQEGVNYLQKYTSVAPDGHKFKSDAVALIDALKKEQNVTPQKVTAPRKKP